jgi:hypothetical protein
MSPAQRWTEIELLDPAVPEARCTLYFPGTRANKFLLCSLRLVQKLNLQATEFQLIYLKISKG